MYQCTERNRFFDTKQGLQLHRVKMHGWVDEVWGFVRGSVCENCGMNFHTRHRLAVHLRLVPLCRCSGDQRQAASNRRAAAFEASLPDHAELEVRPAVRLAWVANFNSDYGMGFENGPSPSGAPHVGGPAEVHTCLQRA